MGPKGCPETSVKNYQYMLCNIPDERQLQLKIRFLEYVAVLIGT
jgi:hypothetical protein